MGFFIDYVIPAEQSLGLVKILTDSDGNTYPYSKKYGKFPDVLPGKRVIYHRKIETTFELAPGHGSWVAITRFETGVFDDDCDTLERYWLETDWSGLRQVFNAYDVEVWLDRIDYDAYNEDFSFPEHPDLYFTKYHWWLKMTIDQPCLPPLECDFNYLERCLELKC